MMTCGTCRGHKEKSIKCLVAALDTIKEHALMMQRESEESAKTIETLKAHNDKLHRALDLLKERQESIVQVEKRRRVSPKRKKDDISPLPQSQDSLNMNIAINSIDISDEDFEMEEEESIAETEPAISPRKLRLPSRKHDIRNLENMQPNNVSTANQGWLRRTPKNSGVLTKLSLTQKGSNLNLKQTRLKFEGNKTSASEKDVIEESPNVSSSSKRARPPRSLLQSQVCSAATENALNANDSKTTGSSDNKVSNLTFEMNEDDIDPDTQIMPPPGSPPALKIDESSDSVVLLTPATQDIIFLNDTTEDINKMGTMDMLAEIMKEDDDACSNALRQFEKKMIDQQKQVENNPPKPLKASIPKANVIKEEPVSQMESDLGNESTKMPEDIEKYMLDIENEDSKESEEEFPQPIVIKEENLSFKDRYNIDCEECEKFINFMGPNLTDEKIKSYLRNCKHIGDGNASPPGFWNPHMVSFAENDPRNEVLIDTRFRDGAKNLQKK
ncbi:uncharacterized protein Dana_GF10340, isoform B [Drosophila ananassae]|uniref:Uncharacterized protein, isoform B n=1 Tax=Drosophila ananassae TaxID=7217 RepID=A0A0P8ZUV4_DROAN|nr:uncharacterized protein LOC6493210 isoform X1 [Drosophila ananassae]KPU78362.1 uncharacterized protein Dana_GF10340, isoform B [Drosophila ananassae]